jgi:hypothetical protein
MECKECEEPAEWYSPIEKEWRCKKHLPMMTMFDGDGCGSKVPVIGWIFNDEGE